MTCRSLLIALTLAVSSAASAADKPNVLFLICDDLNCDLGCYGHPIVKTPNIDALAARGVRFDRAYCQYPLCGPSRASFMTGMYPDQTLVRRNTIYIREHVPNVVTMSQMFRANGYYTTRVGKIFHYNVPKHIGTAGHDDPYSWHQTFNPRGRDAEEEDKIFSLKPGNFGGIMSWLAADGTDEEQTDGIAAVQTEQLLKKYAKDKRSFFLAVGLYRPHTPYVAPKKYFEMYPREKLTIPGVPDGYLETIPKPARRYVNRKDQRDLPEDITRQAMQAYFASITFADAQLGRILNALKTTGLDRNTIVVFTSDHGYHMGEHGHWQKLTLFENAARVPLIIATPDRQSAGGVVKSPAEMVDFYPTLAELTGLETPGSVSGVSLVNSIKDTSVASRKSALTQLNNGYTIRTATHRYTEWGEDGKLGAELYDHVTDPNELNNLADDAEFADLRKELADHLHDRIADAKKSPKGVTQIEFDNKRRVPRDPVIRP